MGAYQTGDRIRIGEDPGVVLEVLPGGAKYRVRLDNGTEVSILEWLILPEVRDKAVRGPRERPSGDHGR